MVQAFREAKTTAQVAKHSRKQEGVIRLDQALSAGLSKREVEGMIGRGEWRRAYRAVFIDNSVPTTPLQAVVAASFASSGLASHRLCLWLWDLRPGSAPEASEFSVAYARNVHLAGVKIYRVKKLPPAFRRGIVPVTSPMRGLLDTAAVAPEIVQDAMTRAFVARLFTPKAVEAEVDRATTNGKRGVTALRAALKDLGVGRYTPSELERQARRRDSRKQNRIVIGNHWILRYDWVDVVEDADRTAAEILEAYTARTTLTLG